LIALVGIVGICSVEQICNFDKVFTKSLSPKCPPEADSTTLRGMFFCRAVHYQSSAVAQPYPYVQCLLAKGSYRAPRNLCHFDYWRSFL
jgi:hypothetical protein